MKDNTNARKKTWTKPEIVLLASNDIQKNVMAAHESTLRPDVRPLGTPVFYTQLGDSYDVNVVPFNDFHS